MQKYEKKKYQQAKKKIFFYNPQNEMYQKLKRNVHFCGV